MRLIHADGSGGFLGGEPGAVPFSGLFIYYYLVPVPVWGPQGGPPGSPLGGIHGGDPPGGIPRGSPEVQDRFWNDSGSILGRFKVDSG
jgi:hypothetical protein